MRKLTRDRRAGDSRDRRLPVMILWKTMENLAPVICNESTLATATVAKQEQGKQVVTTPITLPSNMALHQETRVVVHGAISEEKVSETASFESQAWRWRLLYPNILYNGKGEECFWNE